jgi:hypothetical protein
VLASNEAVQADIERRASRVPPAVQGGALELF